MVESINQKNDFEWELKLKDNILFSDGTKVNADLVSKGLNRTNEKNAVARATARALQFSPVDEFTLNIKSEKPTKIMKSILAEWNNVIYKEENGNFIFTGPYIVENLIPDTELKLKPNKYYSDYEKRGEIVIKVFKDPNTMKLAFESKEIDIAFPISSEFSESLKNSGYTVKSMNVGYQYFAFVNLKNKILSDLKVREAIDLALDRDEFISAIHGGKKPTGIFAGYFPFAGKEEVTYDINKAASLLDEAGWKLNSQNMREKNGEILSLTLVTYPQRPDLVTIMQVMSSQLKKLGIEAKTEIVENIREVALSKKFDIMLFAQHTAPTGDPNFTLSLFFDSKSDNNYTEYSSPEMEKLISQINKTDNNEEIVKYTVEAQKLLKNDRPVLLLVDPVWYVGLSEKVKNYDVWGSDYRIIREDLGL